MNFRDREGERKRKGGKREKIGRDRGLKKVCVRERERRRNRER
jgi:hypothetical protein